MSTADGLTVGATAESVGVSVRTLHHWDAIGLLVPSGRTWSGYRLYDDGDLTRLHRILVYRELGFSLAQIEQILAQGTAVSHLREQRALLDQRISRLQEMASAVDRMIQGETMSIEKKARLFGDSWKPEYESEAQSRWGDTAEWAESQQRFSSMSEAEIARWRAEGESLEEDLAQATRDGADPASDRAVALVERHRALLSAAYEVSLARQVILADMYVTDPRFTEHYDRLEPGLAAWLREAVRANAQAHGVDLQNVSWAS
jgi:DNA-binding transcriptional MerR regulator